MSLHPILTSSIKGWEGFCPHPNPHPLGEGTESSSANSPGDELSTQHSYG